MKKIIITISLSAFLFLTGFHNANASSPLRGGNIGAKAESLSTQNTDDIKSDLVSLNAIINSSNTKAEELRNEMAEPGTNSNQSKIKTILEKSKALLESTNQSLLNLTLKSQEVQKIRLEIYQGNALFIRFYELYFKENKTEEDKQELAQLQRQAGALQSSVGKELDALNSEYNIQ